MKKHTVAIHQDAKIVHCITCGKQAPFESRSDALGMKADHKVAARSRTMVDPLKEVPKSERCPCRSHAI